MSPANLESCARRSCVPLAALAVLSLLALVSCAQKSSKPAWADEVDLVTLTRRYEELSEQVQKQRETLDRLTARLEIVGLQHSAGTTREAKTTAQEPTPREPASVPVSRLVPLLPAADGESAPPASGETVADSSHDELHIYFKGLRSLKDGEYENALRFFRQFLAENRDHVYADRAQFNIAQSHFLNKEYSLVVVATNLLETRYPSSVVMAEALLKKAHAYLALGQSEAGRTTLENVVRRFPETAAAKTATLRLSDKKTLTP